MVVIVTAWRWSE